jgi:predicted ATPase
MRISFSGSANTGKSTLVNAFLNKWPMYETPKTTYRDFIKDNNLEHSSKTSDSTQLEILNWMLLDLEKYPKDSNVVFDRCPWDNLAYTLQGNANGIISDPIVAATISLVKKALSNIDIIFWIKRNPKIAIVNDGMRDVDETFISQTETIFNDLFDQYCNNLESDIFYPKEDCPAIIQIDQYSIDDRLWFIDQYIDYKGDLIETTTSILDPDNIDLLEQLINEQKDQIKQDAQLKMLVDQIKNNK